MMLLSLSPILHPFFASHRPSPPETLVLPKPRLPFSSHQPHGRHLLARTCASGRSSSEPVVSILSVLRSHDIPEDDCTTFISQCPQRLRHIKPLKNLDPKLQFLRSSAGLSGIQIGEILVKNPYLLSSKLHPSLSSFVTFLSSLLPSKSALVRVLKSVLCAPTDRIKANLQVLRHRGVPERVIKEILLKYPRPFATSTEKLVATLDAIEKRGISPTCKTFASAVAQAPYHRGSLSHSSTEAPVATIFSVLRSHDIPEDTCTAFISKCPERFLRLDPLKNLHPKLQLLRSSGGLSGVEVGEILLANPHLLRSRLHPNLSSFVTFLASFLPSSYLVCILKSVVNCSTNRAKANLRVLRDRGVPEGTILSIVRQHPRSLVGSTGKLAAALSTARSLGMSPATRKMFANVVGVASYMSEEGFLRKVELFTELGWSEEQVLSIFRSQPACLTASEAKLRKNLAYFKEVLGWGSENLCSNPLIIKMSLEKRIIPRCAVLNELMMKGILEKKKWNPTKFTMSYKRFFEDFVDKYKEEIPQVLEAYEGKIKFAGWEWLEQVEEF